MEAITITMDGGAACGKSTTARSLALALGYRHLNTGLLYRGVGYAVQGSLGGGGVSGLTDAALGDILDRSEIGLVGEGDGFALVVSGERISESVLLTDAVASLSSALSKRALVRAYLLDKQRAIAAQKGVIVDGRDIGSVVYPEAELKVYLYARVEAVAFRRWFQDRSLGYAGVFYGIQDRDMMDRHRAEAPLRCPVGAYCLDTTHLTIGGQVAEILAWARKI